MTTEKPSVLFLNNAHPILRAELELAGLECFEDLESTVEELKNKLGTTFGLVLRSRVSLRRELLDAAPNLRFIAREGIGLEHIDTEYAAAKGIQVFNSPEGSRDTVGEHAIGFLLSLLNHINRADRQVRQYQWNRESNRAVELKGRTVGILGYGNIGRAFARKLQGFECEVIAYDKYQSDYGDAHARAVDLETLFAKTDILSIHIPYEKANHYFINEAFLQAFHKPIFLLNTARGLVLNTADLVAALESGKVLGAALDVLEYEESSFEDLDLRQFPAPFQYLIQNDRVILTPHIAGWSVESKEGHARVLAEKIIAWYGANFA